MTSHDDEKDRLFALIPEAVCDLDGNNTVCDFCYRAIWEPVMNDPQASLLTLRRLEDLLICEGCWSEQEVRDQFSLDELRQAAGEKEKAA